VVSVSARDEGTDEIVVEAPTTEGALAQVASRLGPGARIASAEKVLRGGVGGFFQREVVQVRAVRDAEGGGAEAAEAPGAPRIDRLLADLSADADGEERSFSQVLRERLGTSPPPDVPEPHPWSLPSAPTPGAPPADAAPPAAAARPAEAPAASSPAAAPAPAAFSWPRDPAATAEPGSGEPRAGGGASAIGGSPAPAAAPAPAPAPAPPARAARSAAGRGVQPPGSPLWSRANLVRLGLPRLVTDAVEDLEPGEDLRWAHAVAEAVAPLCRPLPSGDQLLAGPAADQLAVRLGLPVGEPGQDVPEGSFGVRLGDSDVERAWLRAARGGRWLHLVVGDGPYRRLLFDEPAAVSWTGRAHLPAALALAADLDLVLGHGLIGTRTPPTRAVPAEIALAVRASLPTA